MATTSCPVLPPLYFVKKGPSINASAAGQSSTLATELPAEVLHRCLAVYADWGDLAKLATVHRSWSSAMYDAANASLDSKWSLARALLRGTNGLERNAKAALNLLLDLASVPTNDDNFPIEDQQQRQRRQPESVFCPAMREIARLYLTGEGVPSPDAETALAWLKAAYRRGDDSQAAFELAGIYEHGRFDVDQDVVAAAEWFRKAAVGGQVEAMAELGLCYELGCGVDQSDELAVEWYRRAAESGHVQAKYSVGEAFEEARGVPQSDTEACLWYFRAAKAGDEDSLKALKRLHDIARIVLPGQASALLDG